MKQLCVLLLLATCIGHAYGQDSTIIKKKHDTAYHHLHEVVVKESAVQVRKEQAALNIEVVNRSFIERNLSGSLMKTLDRLPGVKTIGIGSGQSKPLIRGLGFNRVVVVDKGVKHEGQQWGADHGLEIDQFAVQEVELVKGAASFLYGSDAIAGVIDVRPAPVPPMHTFNGSVALIGKSNNRLYGTSLNLAYRKHHWFVDARITYQNYGDYRVPAETIYVYDYAVQLKDRRLRNTAGRETNLHFNTGYIGDRFRSIFYISKVSGKSGFFANAHGLEPRSVDTALHDASMRDLQMPRQEVDHLKIINRSSYTTGIHRFELDLGFQHNFRQEFSSYVNHGYMPAVYPETLATSRMLEREFDKYVYSLNFRDQFTLGQHTITAGITSELQQNKIDGWSFLVPAFKQSAAGAFVYDRYDVNDRITLHGALRYDYGRIKTSKYQDWFASANNEYLVRADALDVSFNSLVWSVGLNYKRGPLNLKLNAGKSFRMPIAKELAANGVNYHYFSYERGNASLAAEQSYQVDLGMIWDDDKWYIQLNPFYNYFPNYIYLNPTAQHDYYYGAGNQVFEYQQSRVVRYGGELQLRYKILDNISAEVLGEYLYAQQLSGEKKGYTLPFSPPPSMLMNLTWSPKNSYLSFDYRLTAKQDKIVPPERKTPGYGIANLQAGTQLKIWQQPVKFSFQVQNLFNTRYMNHTSFYRLISLPEIGRDFVLSIKIPFTLSTNKNN